MNRIAITGGTGFVGGHQLDRALASGLQINALTRRVQPKRDGVTWVEGSLEDGDSLGRLMTGADAVVHVAGAISARGRDAFRAANLDGTERVIAAARANQVRRLVHVSSLAAREPGISDYGWSKALAEDAVRGSGLDWTIVRPPAVYGPGDRETLELFRMARRGFVLLPPRGRMSLIHVDDLARLLLACIEAPKSIGALYEPDDGTHNGLSHRQFAQTLGRAVGKRVTTLSMPGFALRIAARLDRLARRRRAKLTPDRARYFCHSDWTADPARMPPAALWTPAIPADEGLADTAAWYRAQGWLR